MRKKPQLILTLCIFLTHFLSAQEYSIGLKGGVNYNSIGDFFSKGGSISAGVPDINYKVDNEIGTQFGIFFSINYENFFIRPEVNYVSLKNSYPFPTKPAKWTAQQIDIPLLLGYKIYKPISIYAGPVFSFISDIKLEGWEVTSYSDGFIFKDSSTSVCIGTLIDFGVIGIDFRYQYGLTTIESQRLDMIKTYNGYGVNLGDLTEYNPSQILVSIHFKFLSSNSAGKRNRGSGSSWRNHKNL